MRRLDVIGLPFAPIARPEDLFDDPHLNAGDGLVPLTLPSGATTRLPALPVELDGQRCSLRHQIPREGEHSAAVLREAGYSDAEITRLAAEGIVRLSDRPAT